jgi:glutathione synthase/RimK-type ligase-like ATP-grasp enzyme
MKKNNLLILVDKIGKKINIMADVMRKDGLEVSLARFSDLVIEIRQDEVNVSVNEEDINRFDLVYFRRVGHDFFSLAGTLALCLDFLGIKYFDTRFKEIGPGGDKFTSLTKLAISGINIPHTMFIRKDKIANYSSYILKKINKPVIAKEHQAQRNSQIFILRNVVDFEKLHTVELKDREAQFLFQEYIDIDNEYRLLVLKYEIAVVHTKAVRNYKGYRVIDDTPADNITFIDPNEIPKKVKAAAIKAAKALDLQIAGVDVCIEEGTGKVYILEVNRGPGFIHDPKLSPEIPQLARFFAQQIKGK